MANTLTNLIPDLYEALDVVSREQVGFIPSVFIDASAERAAVNQTIRSIVAPAASAGNVAAAATPADDGDNVFTNKTISISKSRYVPIRWNGEEVQGVNANGPGYQSAKAFQIQQAMRTLVNEMEADLAALYSSASNAAGPAGTTLFDAANYKDVANVAKLLDINGAPPGDRSLVLDPSAAAAFRGNATYSAVNTAGNDTLLRQGVMLDQFGIAIRQSGQVQTVSAVGTGASATTDNAGYAVGATVITLASAGTGTIVAGDVITIAGDATGSSYVVASGDNDVSNGGTITLAAPGLKGALSAATHNITVNASLQKNMAFSRNAIVLVARAPALPPEGDMADDAVMIQDPRSGIAFELRMYKQYRRVKYELAAAWGVAMIKPEHCVLLID